VRETHTEIPNLWLAKVKQQVSKSTFHFLGISGIREAIGPIPKKLSPLLAADGALLVDTSAQLERWVDHYISIYSQHLMSAVRHYPACNSYLSFKNWTTLSPWKM